MIPINCLVPTHLNYKFLLSTETFLQWIIQQTVWYNLCENVDAHCTYKSNFEQIYFQVDRYLNIIDYGVGYLLLKLKYIMLTYIIVIICSVTI